MTKNHSGKRPGRKRLDSRPKCDTCGQGGDSHGKKKIIATLYGYICTDCQRKQENAINTAV